MLCWIEHGEPVPCFTSVSYTHLHNGHFPFRLGGLRLIYYNPPPCVCQCKRKCSTAFLRMYVCKRSVGLQFGLRVLRLLQIIYGGIKHGR